MNALPNAYNYARFPNASQETGDSLRCQNDAAIRWLAANPGYVLDTELEHQDKGVSGYRGKHLKTGALGVFLKAVADGLVLPGSVLLVEKEYRLGRRSRPNGRAR